MVDRLETQSSRGATIEFELLGEQAAVDWQYGARDVARKRRNNARFPLTGPTRFPELGTT